MPKVHTHTFVEIGVQYVMICTENTSVAAVQCTECGIVRTQIESPIAPIAITIHSTYVPGGIPCCGCNALIRRDEDSWATCVKCKSAIHSPGCVHR